MDKVVVVIPNWNGETVMGPCLESLRKQTLRHNVVVVDNGSTDSSVRFIEKNFPEVTILRQSRNLGFAGGVNIGISYALQNGFTHVALFNNDAVADKNWLVSLGNEMSDDKVGIVTGLLLNDKGNKIDSTGEQLSKWGLAFPRERGLPKDRASKRGRVFGASGGASLYRLSMLKKIGLFDEDFFAYYEDTDVSFRAQLTGWKIVYTPLAIAFHQQGATSKKLPGFTVYHTFKNMPLLFFKNVPARLLFPVGIRLLLAYTAMLFNAIIKGRGWAAIKGWLASILYVLRKIPSRHQIQKHKTVSSSYIRSVLWDDLPPDQAKLRRLRKIFTGR